MNEYNKIDNIFKRDEKTKKLATEYTNRMFEQFKDCLWVFTEKIDGTNIRVIWDGYRVSFAGRTDKAVIPQPLLNKLQEYFGGNANEELFENVFGNKQVVLYGEGYGEKIQTNGYLESGVDFILFDVAVDGIYLDREDAVEIAQYWGIKFVPTVYCGTLQGGVDLVKSMPKSFVSQIGRDSEGVVGRLAGGDVYSKNGKRCIVKIKCCDFKG